jgi:beta-lactamase class A
MVQFLKKIWIPLGAFLLGAILIWFFQNKSSSSEQKCSGDYPFISSEIDCETIDDVASQVDELHSNISEIINEEKERKNIIRASVFYRDLKSRRWFGINDLEKYYPASLLKLPMALTYFKIAELQPDILAQKLQIPIEGEIADNSDQYYKPENPLVPGNTYSIHEMIEHMLIYSDNAPFSVLNDSAKVFGNRVFADLGVYSEAGNQGEETWNFSPRVFANVFRMLYNASYVNVKYSNEILDLLSRSSFKKGIVAGVPSEVKVAHKFGEATAMKSETEVNSLILNDCGIVYKPEKPYIICVMTEGNDFSKMEKVIEKISKSAYGAF